jgi:arylsulfatase A-like enzyme
MKRNITKAFGLVLSAATAAVPFSGIAAAQEVLPLPPAPFKGKIGLSAKDSKTDFPKPVQAPKGAPNVVVIILDDAGYGSSSTFGGPCDTPTLDKLAQNGLRYTQFHTTAVSSPTRAALLTGRNHHSVHTGNIMEFATGFPGYDSLMGKDTATIAEILRQKGWNTAWIGKDHNVPDWQSSQAGPFDLWPTSLGFEKFYGFIGGETSQWRPAVFDGITPIEPYLGNPDYNLDYDLADQAIRWVRNQKAVAPDRPFFLYYAPGATHAPHHPKKEWVAKYKGKFDQGWDRVREEILARQKKQGIVPTDTLLTKRHAEIPAWDSLNAEQKQLYAYMMEIYAGYLSQTDYNVGRVLDAIQQLGQMNNTLVIYISGDNGASAEGTIQGSYNEMTFFNMIPEDYREVLKQKDNLGTWKTHNHYPVGWAHAMNAPFQWVKAVASHYGGTANGLVISWPAVIKDKGSIRPQWHHIIDIVPTILEVTGIEQPSSVNGVAQKPIEGVSMAYSFGNAKAPSTHHTQYFELFAFRAIYHDGWVACTTPPAATWEDQTKRARPDVILGYNWELYHVAEDFSEALNVADKYPDKLRELQLLFYAEAAKYNVLPLDDTGHSPQPHARPHRVHLLRKYQTHSRGRCAGHQEQVVPHHRRCADPPGRCRRHPGDARGPVGRLRADVRERETGLSLQCGQRGPLQHRGQGTPDARQAHRCLRFPLRRRRDRQGRHRHHDGRRQTGYPGADRPNGPHPLLDGRNLRCGRGHRHTREPGL